MQYIEIEWSEPRLWVSDFPQDLFLKYLATLNSTNDDVMQNTRCFKAG